MRQASGDGLAKIVAAEAGARRGLQHALQALQALRRPPRRPDLARPAGARRGDPLAARLARPRARGRCRRVRARAARRRQPGDRIRARPRGPRQQQHRARDAARPRRPRLLRDQGEDDREGEARPGAEVNEDRPSTAKLEPHEREVLEFFDQLLGEKTVALSEMSDKIPKHSALWRGRWETMTEKLDKAGDGELGWDRDWRFAKALVILGFLAAIVYVTAAYADIEHKWFLPRRDRLPRPARAARLPGGPPAADQRRAQRARRPLAGVRALDRGLPEARRRPAGDARALAADPRLRRRVRYRVADDRVGPDPGAGDRRLDDRRPLEHLRVPGSLSDSSFSASSFSSGFSSQVAPVRALERRRRRRVLGRRRRRRLLRRRRRRLVVSAARPKGSDPLGWRGRGGAGTRPGSRRSRRRAAR